MKFAVLKAFVVVVIAIVVSLPAHAKAVRVTVDKDVMDDYLNFVDGRDVQQIDYYGGKKARRDAIELVLLEQALHLGGYKPELDWVLVQGYHHSLQLIAGGVAAIRSTPAWGNDAYRGADDFYISVPVIQNGEFLVGLYTASDNQKALAAGSDIDKLKALTAVANRQWFVDWKTLNAFGFKGVVNVRPWPKMVKSVLEGQGDFTLAPFQASDGMKLTVEGLSLVPIPNVKMALDDTRHWVVSKKHPEGQAIYQALQKGLKQMLGEGRFSKAYRESGFYNDKVEHWRTISVEEQEVAANKKK